MSGPGKKIIALWTIALSALLVFGAPKKAEAQDFYIGQILTVGYNFCPRNTTEAAGQLLPISQNTALFSLYGTTYGGDGRTTFGLPDLRGRSPIGQGQGPGLANRPLGQSGGTQTQTLTPSQIPSHSHNVFASSGPSDFGGPQGKLLGSRANDGTAETIYSTGPADKVMSPQMIGNTGGSQAFALEDPYLAIRYCVVLFGIFPSRN